MGNPSLSQPACGRRAEGMVSKGRAKDTWTGVGFAAQCSTGYVIIQVNPGAAFTWRAFCELQCHEMLPENKVESGEEETRDQYPGEKGNLAENLPGDQSLWMFHTVKPLG